MSIALSSLLLSSDVVAQQIAVAGATIIDGTGKAPLRDGVVLIRDGRIAAVGRSRDIAIPDGARRLDARGKYVIPGLMDAHVHLSGGGLEMLIKYEDRYHEIILEAAQTALKGGVTTVFDVWGPRAALVKARDLINAGKAPGSRIFLAGSVIGWSGPLGADFSYQAAGHVSRPLVTRINEAWEQGTGPKLLWMTPEEVRAVVRRYAQKDVDFLKYAASEHNDQYMSEVGPDLIPFSPRVQRVIVEEGHRAGITVQAHTTTVESLDLAIEAGVDILSHGDITGPTTLIPEETIRKLVERRIAVVVRPFTEQWLKALKPEVGKYVPLLNVEKTNLRNLINAGATLLVGPDGMVDYSEALVALEEMGMGRMEILKAATSQIANAYNLDMKIGTLERGKLADLVILDANPLESARHYRRIHVVIKDGRVVDRDALPLAPILSSRARAR